MPPTARRKDKSRWVPTKLFFAMWLSSLHEQHSHCQCSAIMYYSSHYTHQCILIANSFSVTWTLYIPSVADEFHKAVDSAYIDQRCTVHLQQLVPVITCLCWKEKPSTYKWHVFLTQIHHRVVDSVTGQEKSEEDDQQSWRTFHNSQLMYNDIM